MDYKADEFRNVARVSKSRLMKKSFIVPVGSNEYQFKISGLGQKAIKIDKFFRYSDIIDAVQEGIDDGLEFLIEQVIIDPNKIKAPNLDDYRELQLRANANKQALKKMFIEAFVGIKQYEFKIAGIGRSAIKLEVYIGYEDIANELNRGNEINLEFILKEILVGNDVDYSIFEDIDPDDYLDDSVQEADEHDEMEPIVFDKLSSKESEEIISKIKGIQKLIFDSIDEIDSDIFTVNDVLKQDLIKSYEAQGQSMKPIVIKNIDELIDLGIITNGNDDNYYKLW